MQIVTPRFRNIAKASTFITSATLIYLICSLIALGLNTRALGLDQFGRLALIQAYFSFISGLATFDNWQPVVRLGIKSPSRLGLILGSGICLDASASAAAATIAAVGLFVFAPVLGFESEETFPLLFYGMSLLAGVGGTPKGYFRLVGRFDVLAKNQMNAGLLLVGASLALWYVKAPFEAYLIVFGLITAFPGISILLRMIMASRRAGITVANPFGTPSRRRYFKIFLSMASGNSILSTLSSSRHQIALFIVTAVSGSMAAGLFAVASRCANAFSRFLVPINQVVFPEIIRLAKDSDTSKIRRTMHRITVFAAVGSLLLIVLVSFASDLVVTIAAGPEFAGAAQIFTLVFAAEVTLWAGFHLTPLILKLIGQSPLLSLNLTITALTTLASLGMAKYFGVLGVAGAMLGGAICTYLALHLMARHAIWVTDKQGIPSRGVRG